MSLARRMRRRQHLAQDRAERDAIGFVAAGEHLMRRGLMPHALDGFRRAMALLGTEARVFGTAAGRRALYLSAIAAYQLRIYDEAIVLMELARAADWRNPHVHYNLGLFQQAALRPEEAVESYRTALALDPSHAAALNNLGNALRELGDLEASEHCYQQLFRLDPTDPHARYNLSHVLLLRGELARGFQLYESRWDVDGWRLEYGRPDIPTPRLGTRPLREDQRRILVHQEQGLGDTLMAMRYVPMLAAQGWAVTVEIQRPLMPWLGEALAPYATVITRGDPLPAHDVHIAMLSLPAYFGTAGDADIPPVLTPQVRGPGPLAHRPGDRRPVIGFAWAGSPGHHADHYRSVDPRWLAPLFARPDTRFVSLQVGDRGTELWGALPGIALGEGSTVEDCSWALTDFARTAALIRQCDAVVTVDTSVAHLAGTLGARTYVLLNWLSEWRWQLHREDSPWYPTVRLVRQPTLGDWPAVAARVRTLLEDL